MGNSSPALCDGCQTGLDIGLHTGGMVTPDVALQVEGLFLSVAPNVLSKSGGKHDALVGSLQYWVTRRVWLKGGVGAGSVERHTPNASSRTNHPAGIAGAGLDFNPRSRFVLDLSLVALVTGDSEAQFANEPAHKAVVTTALLRLGVTWRTK